MLRGTRLVLLTFLAILLTRGECDSSLLRGLPRKSTAKSESVADLVQRGRTLHAEGNLQGAYDVLNVAINTDPTHGQAHHMLSVTLMDARMFDAALGSATIATKLLPGDAAVWVSLAELHRRRRCGSLMSARLLVCLLMQCTPWFARFCRCLHGFVDIL